MTSCAKCAAQACYSGQLTAAPSNCPMKTTDVTDTRDIYADPSIREMARVSALIEATGYLRWTRVEETIEFARRMGYTRLGLAFCVGLRREAAMLTQIFEANGLEVVSVACKAGSIPKEEIGITDQEKVRPGSHEAMCNPVGQARVMNSRETHLNVIFGLCVGHDTLFIKFSQAPVTCLVAKDRALAHNPIGAIYGSQGYFRKALYEAHNTNPPDAEKNRCDGLERC